MEFVHATDHQDVPENATDPEASWMNTAEDEDEYDGENPFQDVDNESLPSIFSRDQFPNAGTLDSNGCPIMVIVDRSGVHHIGVHFCECEGAQSKDIQLLQMGLYPSSFDQPRTSFTFQVLDDFLMDNLECKTTGSNYYSKIHRITWNAFPYLVPVKIYPFFIIIKNTHRDHLFRTATENSSVRPGSGGISSIINGMDSDMTRRDLQVTGSCLSFVQLVHSQE